MVFEFTGDIICDAQSAFSRTSWLPDFLCKTTVLPMQNQIFAPYAEWGHHWASDMSLYNFFIDLEAHLAYNRSRI
jgi:hypothetical protein